MRVSDSDVLKWFSDAALGRRVRVPDVEFCNDISKRINSIIDIGIPGEAIDFLGVSRKYAGLFLRHIPRAREIISEVHGGRGQREEDHDQGERDRDAREHVEDEVVAGHQHDDKHQQGTEAEQVEAKKGPGRKKRRHHAFQRVDEQPEDP